MIANGNGEYLKFVSILGCGLMAVYKGYYLGIGENCFRCELIFPTVEKISA